METNVKSEKINFVELLGSLLKALSPREKDVLERRNNLAKGVIGKETLEKIGQDYKVTRERVRQIERDSIKKLQDKVSDTGVFEHLDEIEGTIRKFLKKYGGVMQEGHLISDLVDFYGLSAKNLSREEVTQHKTSLSFIISQLLADKFEKVEGSDNYHPTWKLKETPWELVDDVIGKLVELIDTHGKPVTVDELFTKLKNHEFYPGLETRVKDTSELEGDLFDLDEAILSYLKTSKKIKKNLFNQVGLAHWNTITPKRTADKIYLVMKESEKPLHFTEIAELINEANFDHKKALPATIHNELILDDRYVLIGRGIYALKEWGYKPGTVAEVIEAILKEKGALTKDEIIEEVGKQRMVKKATINLALMNKEKFEKLPGKKYSLIAR